MNLTEVDLVILAAIVILILGIVRNWNLPEVEDPMRYHLQLQIGDSDFFVAHQSSSGKNIMLEGTCFEMCEAGDFLYIDQVEGPAATYRITHIAEIKKGTCRVFCERV